MSKSIDSIPSDVEVVMTEDLARAFRLCDCEPCCHCCGNGIEVGEKFKLAYIKSCGHFTVTYHTGETHKNRKTEDEMLCQQCTPADLIYYKRKLWDKSRASFDNRHSGYTREHIPTINKV